MLHNISSPPPGVYFWLYPVFEAVGYGEIQWDTQLDTARYLGARFRFVRMQLDTEIQIQWDTAGYSGSAAKWLDTGRQWDTKDTMRYRQDISEIQTIDPKNTRQGRATSKDQSRHPVYTYNI